MCSDSRRAGAVILAVACLLSGSAVAAPPNGTYSAEIGGDAEIFPPATVIQQQVIGGGLIGNMDFNTDVDAVGRITGSGTIDVVGIAKGSGPMQVTGQSGGSARRPVTKLDVRMQATLFAAGAPIDATGRWRMRCRGRFLAEPGIANIGCPGRIQVCLAGAGVRRRCVSGRYGTVMLVPGGPWSVSFELATDSENAVTGTAHVTLATGQELDLTGAGKYVPKKDSSTIVFTGVAPNEAARLTLRRFAPASETDLSGVLRFKVAGQTGTVDLADP